MTDFSTALWNSIPVPTLLLDPDDLIAEVNGAAETFLNASQRALKGRPVLERVLSNADFAAAFQRVRTDEAVLFMNNVGVSGLSRGAEACNVQFAPMMGMPGFLLVMMTPREIAGRLEKAGQARSSTRSAIGMAEMLAHEIKNPLAGITGAAQLLSMGLSNGDLELTELIVGESRRVVALLDQVEQFGNLRPPERRPVNLHDMIDRARRTAALGFAAHMRMVEEYDPSLPAVLADDDQMQQVILNLMRNATQAAGPEGGTITVRTFYDHSLRIRRPDGTNGVLPLQIEVIDDGPGLPEDIVEAVFDPFVSGRENGTGLGLALVSKIVGEHEGLIAVESRPGRTAFRISLPRAPQAPEQED